MKNLNVAEFEQNEGISLAFSQKNSGAPAIALHENSERSECMLTNREMTILRCLSDGKSSIEIADQLFISHYTVRTHRKNILKKAGARNVAHLVQMALVNGWLGRSLKFDVV
jgi:DNA-binding CsgD family transcriptional regulator